MRITRLLLVLLLLMLDIAKNMKDMAWNETACGMDFIMKQQYLILFFASMSPELSGSE
jgi:hypothetical protein